MRSSIILLFLFATVSNYVSSEEITTAPEQESFDEGDNMTMTCGQRDKEYNCKWFRSGRPVNFDVEKRYERENVSNCTFKIISIRADDDGRWKCQLLPFNATDSSQLITLTKRLIVEDINFKTGVHSLSSYPVYSEVNEGQAVKLACVFSSSAPACFWTKDGDAVAIRGRYHFTGDKYDGDCSIEIEKTNWKDNGNWQCLYPRTENWPLTKAATVNLNVLVKPLDPVISVSGMAVEEGATIYITPMATNYYGQNYATIIGSYKISCWSEYGNPAANLTWSFADPEGKLETVSDTSQQTSSSAESHRNLKITHRPLLFNPISSSNTLRHSKVTCTVKHPNYLNQMKSTFIWLLWTNSVSNYYG